MKCSKLKLSCESIFREWRFFRQLNLIYKTQKMKEKKQKRKETNRQSRLNEEWF